MVQTPLALWVELNGLICIYGSFSRIRAEAAKEVIRMFQQVFGSSYYMENALKF